jgi:hypothetical protein
VDRIGFMWFVICHQMMNSFLWTEKSFCHLRADDQIRRFRLKSEKEQITEFLTVNNWDLNGNWRFEAQFNSQILNERQQRLSEHGKTGGKEVSYATQRQWERARQD